MLQICSTKNVLDPNISYHDMSKLFSNIDTTCDAIINNEVVENSVENNEVISELSDISNHSKNIVFIVDDIFTPLQSKPIAEAKEDVLNELKEIMDNKNKVEQVVEQVEVKQEQVKQEQVEQEQVKQEQVKQEHVEVEQEQVLKQVQKIEEKLEEQEQVELITNKKKKKKHKK
jgi:hypothetical protein